MVQLLLYRRNKPFNNLHNTKVCLQLYPPQPMDTNGSYSIWHPNTAVQVPPWGFFLAPVGRTVSGSRCHRHRLGGRRFRFRRPWGSPCGNPATSDSRRQHCGMLLWDAVGFRKSVKSDRVTWTMWVLSYTQSQKYSQDEIYY